MRLYIVTIFLGSMLLLLGSCGRPDAADADGQKLKLNPRPTHDVKGAYAGSTLVFRDSIYEDENNKYMQTLLKLSSRGRFLLNHEIGIYENGADYALDWPIDEYQVSQVPKAYHDVVMHDFMLVKEFDTTKRHEVPPFLDLAPIKKKFENAMADAYFYQRWYASWYDDDDIPSTYDELLVWLQREFNTRIYERFVEVATRFKKDLKALKLNGEKTSDPDAYYDELMGLMELKRQWMYDKPVAVMIVTNRFVAEVFDDEGGALLVREITGSDGKKQIQYTVRLLSAERFGWESKTRKGVFGVGVVEFCERLSDHSLVKCAQKNPAMLGPRLKLVAGSHSADEDKGGPHIEAHIAHPAQLGLKYMARDLRKLIGPKPAAYFQEIPERDLIDGKISINLTFSFLRPSLKIATLQFELVPGPHTQRKRNYQGAVTLLQRLGGPSF